MARPKGALGKNKTFLLNRLKAMYGKDFDPVMKMAQQAVTLDELAMNDPSVTNQKESIVAWGRKSAHQMKDSLSQSIAKDTMAVTMTMRNETGTPPPKVARCSIYISLPKKNL